MLLVFGVNVPYARSLGPGTPKPIILIRTSIWGRKINEIPDKPNKKLQKSSLGGPGRHSRPGPTPALPHPNPHLSKGPSPSPLGGLVRTFCKEISASFFYNSNFLPNFCTINPLQFLLTT